VGFYKKSSGRPSITWPEAVDEALCFGWIDAAHERRFRANKRAWEFFSTQPSWYRTTATWWVESAKKEETRIKRLATLIEDSAHGRTIRQLTRPPKA
jgi:uncharacterized protein YdeI (YjbR/CyaY-like superfamily)